MNRRHVWIGSAAVVAIGLWFVLGKGRQEAPGEETSAPPLAALPPAVAPATPRPVVATRAAEPPAVPAPTKPIEDPETALFKPDKFTVEQALQRAAERKELNDRWQSQAEDRAWATETKARVYAVLGKANLQPTALREVDCRQTICRFALHADTTLQKDVGNMVHAARDLEMETWLMPEPSEQTPGAWDIEVYFPRTGYMLSGGGGRIEPAVAVNKTN